MDLENKTYQWGDIVEIQEDRYGESYPIGNINMEGAVTIPFGDDLNKSAERIQ